MIFVVNLHLCMYGMSQPCLMTLEGINQYIYILLYIIYIYIIYIIYIIIYIYIPRISHWYLFYHHNLHSIPPCLLVRSLLEMVIFSRKKISSFHTSWFHQIWVGKSSKKYPSAARWAPQAFTMRSTPAKWAPSGNWPWSWGGSTDVGRWQRWWQARAAGDRWLKTPKEWWFHGILNHSFMVIRGFYGIWSSSWI